MRKKTKDAERATEQLKKSVKYLDPLFSKNVRAKWNGQGSTHFLRRIDEKPKGVSRDYFEKISQVGKVKLSKGRQSWSILSSKWSFQNNQGFPKLLSSRPIYAFRRECEKARHQLGFYTSSPNEVSNLWPHGIDINYWISSHIWSLPW